MDGKFLFRLVMVFVVLAAIAGIALLAFNAGVAQGMASKTAGLQTQPGVPVTAVGWPFWFVGWPFLGFPLFGVVIGVLLLVLLIRAILFAFWGPRWAHWRAGHGGWRHGWEQEGGIPPLFREWHDRAHSSASGDKNL